MAELAERVRARIRDVLVISEMEVGNRRPIEQWGHDAQWADEFHHALHVLLTGERDGYYEPYGKVADLARAYEDRPAERLVICAQNHDQVGNRAFGDRLPPEVRRLAAAVPAVRAAGAAALHGRGVRRDGAVPVLHRPRRPGDRRGDARGPAQGVRAVRRVRRTRTCPTRRRSTTFERSKLRPGGGRRRAARLLPRADRAAAHAAAGGRDRRRRDSGASCACAAATSSSSPTSTSMTAGAAMIDAEVWPGQAVPARPDRGTGTARTSRSSPRTPSASSSASSTTTGARRAIELTERNAFNWHCYLPGRRPGPALRLPRPRAVRARGRQALQPDEAADRPVREGDRGPDRLRRRAT